MFELSLYDGLGIKCCDTKLQKLHPNDPLVMIKANDGNQRQKEAE